MIWSRGRDLNPRTAVCSRLPEPLGHPGKSNKQYNAVINFSMSAPLSLNSFNRCNTEREWFIRYNVVIETCERK